MALADAILVLTAATQIISTAWRESFPSSESFLMQRMVGSFALLFRFQKNELCDDMMINNAPGADGVTKRKKLFERSLLITTAELQGHGMELSPPLVA
jgi:hypothetical protein